jgi:hypothetical protein
MNHNAIRAPLQDAATAVLDAASASQGESILNIAIQRRSAGF